MSKLNDSNLWYAEIPPTTGQKNNFDPVLDPEEVKRSKYSLRILKGLSPDLSENKFFKFKI